MLAQALEKYEDGVETDGVAGAFGDGKGRVWEIGELLITSLTGSYAGIGGGTASGTSGTAGAGQTRQFYKWPQRLRVKVQNRRKQAVLTHTPNAL